MTVVKPGASAGMTTVVLAVPEADAPPETAGAPPPPRVPSGSTQFTSRCVQKFGMLLRLVESAA